MSQKKPLTQADKPEALTAAELAMRLAKQPEQGGLLKGKQQQVLIKDEDEQSEQIAESADDSEVLAAVEPGSAGANGADNVHLAEVAGAPTSDAPPAAAGSASAGSGAVAAGGTALGELGTGLLIAGGVIAVAAAAGSGGGGGGTTASATAVSGTLVGGPVVAGNGLTIQLFQANGTTPIEDADGTPITATLDANGAFTVDIGSYTGVVIAKTVDAGTGADYVDEATGQPVDLAANLMAMGIASGGTLTLNVNPLTTVAVLAAGADPSAAEVTDTNAAVAQAFGLTDLTGTSVVTTVDANGAAILDVDGAALSNAQQYGAVLAALSGMDAAGGAQATIDTLAANLTVDGADGALNAAALEALLTGAATADGNTTGNLLNLISEVTARSSASVGIDAVATDNAINTTEMGVGVTLTGTNVEDATVSLSIGGNNRDATVTGTTWSYTLTADDYTAMGQGGELITATSSLTTGSGATAVTTTATASRAIHIDTAAPTLSIGSSTTALKAGETAGLTFTFSEAPDGFIAADISASGGTISGLTRSADPKVFTATFTPTADTAAATSSIFVNDNTYSDAAGNNGSGADAPNISIDTLAPTVGIGSDVAALKIGETATVTFTFSEDPGATFAWDGAAGDVVVSGGTLSAISGTGLTRTATFTPADDFEGNASITIAAGAYTDAAGNNGGAGATPAIAIDTLAPTLAISSDDAALKIDETATLTFTFSSAPTGFTMDDVVSTGGSLSILAVSADPKVYTATFTPAAGLEESASITVAAGSYTDAAGNTGGAGASPVVSVDTAAPSIAIGNIAVDNVINATEHAGAVVISGTSTGAEDGQTVTVNLNGNAYTGTVNGNAWSVTVAAGDVGALVDQTIYPVTANVSDLAGNAAAEASRNVRIATSGPIVEIYAMAGDDFINASEYGVDLLISGTATDTDGQTLTVSLNGQDYTSTVTAGAWSVTVDAATMGVLADGPYTVSAEVTDTSNNPGDANRLLTIDTLIATPTVALANDNGGSDSDDLSNDASLVTSAAAADVSRTFTVDGGAASATYTAPTTDGEHTVVVTDTDTAGNTADASVTFTLDKTLDTPTLALSNDTGSSNADDISSDATLTFSGMAADVTRSITVDSGAPSTTYTAPTTDGSHTVVVTDTDNAGNSANASLIFTLDTSIATPTVALANDTGAGNSDGVTNDASLAISATAADVTRSFVVDGGAPAATYTAPTTDGDHTVDITDTDTAGNTASASVSFNLDTTLATPTLALINDTGASDADLVTSDARLTASGTNPDIARTFKVDDGAPTGSYTPPGSDGSHTVMVTDTDPAGNVRTASLTFTRDTTAPTQTVSGVDISADTGIDATDFNTSTAAQTITGTLSAALEAGDTLYGTVDNGGSWTDITAKVSGTGISWDGATLAGSDTIGFRVTDQAGNNGATTGVQDYVLDTTAPSFTSPASAVFPNQGTDTAYTAAASDASAVLYSLDGSSTDAGLFNIDANSGAVTFKAAPSTAAPADAGDDNVYNFNVTATDLAGLSTTQAVAISVVNAPTLSSTLDNVANFEITSNIVLTASENVTAVADKYIHIINDGGDGFRGENTINTQDILVTDTSKVSIVGNVITLNPQFDLDFNNNYHIMVDPGAFLGVTSGQASVATADAAALNFSTVNPSASATATASQAMDSGTDGMVAGRDWWDAEGNSSPLGAAVARDFGDGNKAIAANDLGSIGIATNDFYIAVNNFGAGDMIYIDNGGNNTLQRQSAFTADSMILDLGIPPTAVITAASGTTTGPSGGQFDVALAGSNADTTFGDVAALQSLLGVNYLPILYG
jgi:hypothetical protein